jgi:tetratricopeptide (TPR) repeat protein
MVDCYRFSGDGLDLRVDWAWAQDWYAKAMKLGPSTPAAYYSWGVALAKHGDLDGAAAKLKDANQKGPHWVDPLKAWGDVLVKQGKTKEALVKYDEALKYAPNWKQLEEARAKIAKQNNYLDCREADTREWRLGVKPVLQANPSAGGQKRNYSLLKCLPQS